MFKLIIFESWDLLLRPLWPLLNLNLFERFFVLVIMVVRVVMMHFCLRQMVDLIFLFNRLLEIHVLHALHLSVHNLLLVLVVLDLVLLVIDCRHRCVAAVVLVTVLGVEWTLVFGFILDFILVGS